MIFTHIRAFPKVNISLKVFKAQDELHPLSSRFCLGLSDLYDDMYFCILDSKNKKNVLNSKHLEPLQNKNGLYLSGKFNCDIESNLIYKAFKILNIKKEIFVKVKKNIPSGGGLGGGSANAALSLLAYNEMLNLNLSLESLLNFSKMLGSDVSFFIIIYTQNSHNLKLFTRNIECENLDSIKDLESSLSNIFSYNQTFLSANVSGTGDIITPFYEEMLHFNIFCNDIFCDTRDVFAEFDRLQKVIESNIFYKKSYNVNIDLSLDSKQILKDFSMQELNDLYIPALNLYPELEVRLKRIKSDLKNNEKIFFSGSGSSFFSLKS